MTLIGELLAGKALSTVFKGGQAAVDKLLKLEPPKQMIWVIYEQYGEPTGLSRKEFMAWLEDGELGEAIDSVIDGRLIEGDLDRVGDLIGLQLMNTPVKQRDELAAQIAGSMFRLAPWMHENLNSCTAHLSQKLDRHFEKAGQQRKDQDLKLDQVLKAVGGSGQGDGPASAAEALLRGPLVQIGKEQQSKEAQQLAESGKPAEAAMSFEEIAGALRRAGLEVVAETYLGLAGGLYAEVGDSEAAERVLVAAAETQVRRGTSRAPMMIGQLRKVLPAERGWVADALEARLDFGRDAEAAQKALRVAWEKDGGRAGEDLANYSDMLAWAGEFAELLNVTDTPTGEVGDEAGLRVQLNRLDALEATASDEAEAAWTKLLGNLDRGDEPVWAGIAWQRRGVNLARKGELMSCHDAYRRAMAAFAAAPGYEEQTADALYSLQAASLVNAHWPDKDEMELRALAYEQRGRPDTPVARASALAQEGMSQRLAEKLPGALQKYVLALELHRRAGSLQGQLEVSEKLGELFMEAERPTLAMSNFIAAGKAKEAAAAAKLAPSGEVAEVLRTNGSRWERTAALAVIAEVGERLPTAFFAKVGPWILQEAEREPDTWLAPQPGHQARLALSAVLLALPDEQRDAALERIKTGLRQGLLDLQQAAAKALQHATAVGLVDATDVLIEAFLADPANSRIAIGFLAEKAKEDTRTREAIRAAALENGSALSVMSLAGLVEKDDQLHQAANRAAEALSEAVNVRQVEGGVSVGWGRNFETEAVAARGASQEQRRAAVERLLEIAEDSTDSESNRFSAANALFNMAAAIPQDQAPQVVERLTPLALGEYPLSQWDHNIDDPLSEMRVSVHTQALLWSAAIGAMGRILAEDPGLSRDPLIEATTSAYQRGPDRVVAAATDALAQVTDITMPVPIEVLLSHQNDAVRLAALRCWSARRNGLPEGHLLAALRQDASVWVRHNLLVMAAERRDWSLVEELADADEHSLVRRLAEHRLSDADPGDLDQPSKVTQAGDTD